MSKTDREKALEFGLEITSKLMTEDFKLSDSIRDGMKKRLDNALLRIEQAGIVLSMGANPIYDRARIDVARAILSGGMYIPQSYNEWEEIIRRYGEDL